MTEGAEGVLQIVAKRRGETKEIRHLEKGGGEISGGGELLMQRVRVKRWLGVPRVKGRY